MNLVSPVVVLIVGLLGVVWNVLERDALMSLFFGLVAALGAYEIDATLRHECGEEFEG